MITKFWIDVEQTGHKPTSIHIKHYIIQKPSRKDKNQNPRRFSRHIRNPVILI